MDNKVEQVGGTHYQTGDLPQHWDLVAMYDWDYFQGQIVKYLMRWKKKNGLEDLKKARSFLDKYIQITEKEEINRQSAKRAPAPSARVIPPPPLPRNEYDCR